MVSFMLNETSNSTSCEFDRKVPIGISNKLLLDRLRFCNDLYLFKEDWAIETNAFVDISKYNNFSGNDWGISEKLFPEKLIPMTSLEKVGALDKFLFEQSAYSFPLKF